MKKMYLVLFSALSITAVRAQNKFNLLLELTPILAKATESMCMNLMLQQVIIN